MWPSAQLKRVGEVISVVFMPSQNFFLVLNVPCTQQKIGAAYSCQSLSGLGGKIQMDIDGVSQTIEYVGSEPPQEYLNEVQIDSSCQSNYIPLTTVEQNNRTQCADWNRCPRSS